MKVLAALTTLLNCICVMAIALPENNPASKYMGTKVLRIPTGPSTEALAELTSLISSMELEKWTTVSTVNSHVDLEVPKEVYDEFMDKVGTLLNKEGILQPVIVMHEDLGSSILEESKIPDDYREEAKRAGELTVIAYSLTFADVYMTGTATSAWFNAYHPYADHVTFLSDLAAAYPNNAKVVSAGKSLQNQDITGINIFGSSGSGNKPAIIWHASVHAREWISSMVGCFLESPSTAGTMC